MFDADGLDLLRLGRKQALKRDYPEALRSFQRALQVLAFDGELPVQPQYLSHYGVALAGASGRTEEGRRLCNRSIQLEPYEPEHYLNLGLVLRMSGNRRDALAAFARGLAIRPGHPDLMEAMKKWERRRGAAFPFLPRAHPINRYLGRLLRSGRPGAHS